MTRRRMLVFGIAGLATVACATVGIAYVLRDPVNVSAVNQIREGMTDADVVRMLGRPSDSERQYQIGFYKIGGFRELGRTMTQKIWQGPSGYLRVELEAGLVKSVDFFENEDTLLRKIRRLLRLEDNTPVPVVGPLAFPPTSRPDLPDEDTAQPEEKPTR